MQRFIGNGFTLEQWSALLTEVSLVLMDAGIMPGYQNAVSKPVSGSNYCSYRYDIFDGAYISCEDVYFNDGILPENKFNPAMADDIFSELVLDIQHQPDIRHILEEAVPRNKCCSCSII